MTVRRAVFAPLEGAERQCAVNAILRAAFPLENFLLEERRTEYRAGGGAVAVHKLVSVKGISTGVQRQYSTGRDGGWPFEFERDLRRGLFGRAPESSHGREASSAKAG